MYQVLSRANGPYPTQKWIAAPAGVFTDEAFEDALKTFLTWKAEGQRVILLWVPDTDQGRGHNGMDHLSPHRCPDEHRAAATGLFAVPTHHD